MENNQQTTEKKSSSNKGLIALLAAGLLGGGWYFFGGKKPEGSESSTPEKNNSRAKANEFFSPEELADMENKAGISTTPSGGGKRKKHQRSNKPSPAAAAKAPQQPNDNFIVLSYLNLIGKVENLLGSKTELTSEDIKKIPPADFSMLKRNAVSWATLYARKGKKYSQFKKDYPSTVKSATSWVKKLKDLEGI